jgi:dienelactone hydrolase
MILHAFLLMTMLQEPEAHRVGSYSISFTIAHPLSDLKELAKRQGWNLAELRKKEPEFENRRVDAETFHVVVPEGYSRDKSFGLLVWISPGDSGVIPDEWLGALARRNLIAVGADRSGNDRGVAYRLSMALDAVHNLKARYSIDPKRVYVTGFSGGGRTASRAGMTFPDVFTGGVYQGGMDFYRGVQDPADAKREFPPMFAKPAADLLKLVKNESRHVVLVGSGDFNRPSSKAIFEVMTKTEKFARTTYLEMPGKEHEPADAEAFEKALDALDAPLKEGKPNK